MWLHLIAGTLLATSAPQPAAAQGDDDEGDVCVTVLTLWSGGAADRRAIASEPVPVSFRKQFSWQGCQTLDTPALVEWHLAFGTEQTTAAALAWLEAQSLADVPTLREVERDLKDLLKTGAARPELTQARSTALAEALERCAFLGDQYVRAAEFHHSPALLAKAERFVAITRLGLQVLFNDEIVFVDDRGSSVVPGPLRRLVSSYAHAEWRDLEMRFVIEQARLSRKDRDIAAAKALLARHRATLPTREEATDNAIAHSGDPCADVPKDSELEATCDKEANLTRRLASYWTYAALIDDLRDGDAPPSPSEDAQAYYYATQSARFERDADVWYASSDDVRKHDRLVALRISHALALDRRVTLRPPAGGDSDYQRFAALRELVQAERLVSPVTAPGRFRQIGAHFRMICQAMIKPQRCASDPLLGREYRYLAQDWTVLDQARP